MARSPGISPKSLLHPGFTCARATLLIAALVTDLMYWETSNWQWANLSAWLITAGLILALVATITLIVDFIAGRARRIDWIAFALVALAALLSLLNVFIHSRDAWTSVVPQGVSISGIVTILLLMAAFNGWKVSTARTTEIGERT
ncbi:MULTISPECIES: DUF2231 domain-containing protein [unclassified Bradyrhizobium]